MTTTILPPQPPQNDDSQEQDIPDVQKASSLSKFFFLKPVFGILLCFLLVIGGVIGAVSMVKEGDPDINVAIASIETIWPGADPETIENQITDKIENELKSLKGLKEISSASYDGRSRIVVEFRAEAPVNESIALLRAQVDEAKPELPRDAEQPKVEQISVQDTPVLTIGLFGNIDMAVLSHTGEDIKDILEKVPNVRKVELGGERKEVIQVQLIPSRLTTLGISPTQVSSAIQQGNIDMPWEQVESDRIGTQVRLYGRFRSVEELQDLPVARLGGSNGRVVRLKEIAEVRRDLEREKNRAFLSWNGGEFEPVINVDVVKVPGSDTIKVVKDSIAALDLAQQNPNIWPHGLEYRVINSDAQTIQEDLRRLFDNCWQGILVVFVILFFALSWREALIAGLSIPLTFMGAIAILWIGGQTLNSMVTIGMILALGLLVDVYILMMEGLHEGIFVRGLTFNQAALSTVKTYGLAAFSGQLTTILAMAPLMAISGTMGKFIRFIPISAITCLVLSYIIALFIDVPLSRFLLGKVKNHGKKTWVDHLNESAAHRYAKWSLKTTVSNKRTASLWVLGTVSLFVCTLILVGTVPGTLFPDSDKLKMSINVELPPTTTLDTSQQVADEIGEVLRQKDYLTNMIKFVGQRSNLVTESGMKPNQGNYLVGFSAMFTPKTERELYSFEYDRQLRQELDQLIRQYPGASLVVNTESTGEGGDPIAIQIQGRDMTELRRISGEVQMALRQIPGTTDVRDDLGALRPDIKFRPRREAMNFYGLNPDDLAMQGRYMMTDNEIGSFPIGGGEEDLEIRLSMAWPSRGGAVGGPTRQDELQTIRVFAGDRTLSAAQVLESELSEAPLSIVHKDTQRTVTVLAKTDNRTLGEILGDFQPKLDEMRRQWPQGYDYKFAGEAQTQSETFGSAQQMAGVAIFLVFAVLVIQFGSFTQPFIIMLTIPFGLIGTFGGFFLAWIPISFPAVIGIISLVGIVVNNAIVMVETMNTYRDRGMTIQMAAVQGAADRLRPVLSTSLTTIGGVVPLAFSDPVWFPLCAAIGFGLTASTVIALLVVPALYLLLTPKPSVSVEHLE
ncbi:efflux RND transporter permease subunit [Laspinema sp. A4]|uniref:efflux RND transporter permease subunit n=1 Tax=Laspinema sp. D2d TaxID=2953686 RepID=UPI0021BB01C2|nr:efflux RND transporter permease subunit [Laspinema sp. D2d]MCT7983029.1 efflux RND transporter permease subunit [Laspinema sp. D2d]